MIIVAFAELSPLLSAMQAPTITNFCPMLARPAPILGSLPGDRLIEAADCQHLQIAFRSKVILHVNISTT
ncbi:MULTISPECIES: hypothetical protein [Sphingobium]|jgi:hypothetical protein|uniref:Uncharacterized protein n=1 Tax=Sphingobium tyrosinilyticum TaxID=2715436 RepID=A0ABV9ETC2_9SPHN|nr:hypothetical protein [Sphingobium sp. EP60837]